MVPKPIVANSSFVTYKYGKNKLGVEVSKNKKRIKKRYIDSQPIKSKYFLQKPIFENGIAIKYAFAAVTETRLGTIHLRRRQILTIFDPYPPPSAVFYYYPSVLANFLSLPHYEIPTS